MAAFETALRASGIAAPFFLTQNDGTVVLADVGEKAAVKVEDAELGRSLSEFVRNYPGQEQQVWEYYRKNPQALAQLRAPLFEEKVVDHIIAQAKVTHRTVSREELLRVEEEPGPAKAAPQPVLEPEPETAADDSAHQS